MDGEKREQFGRELAAALGEGWSSQVRNRGENEFTRVELRGPRVGLDVTWYHDHGKPRASARVIWPRDAKGAPRDWLPYGVASPRCTWAADRTAAQVAGHIRRAVLAVVDEHWPEVSKRIAQDRGYTDGIIASRARTAAALGLQAWPMGYDRGRAEAGSVYNEQLPVEIEARPAEWKITAVLPIDRGEAVVRLIRATDEDREALAELVSVVDMARMRYMPCDCGGEVCLRCRLDVALPKVTVLLGELGLLCS